ncbi:hypothetical protein FD754_005382 [Muntiacus muntjak]|uniref:Cytochrome P450 family 4 subfamily A member 11 n=1 Tax=Muntiacus muntjak TaxID=9888 RepID=A0A5N3WLX5_MUNMU|nr:hypothetical protein FD754_005382 [Muntiacus muntjak]
MSVSALSSTRALGGVSGLLQVVSLLGLVPLLLKAAQLYLFRQWLLKALHHFPSPPSHWFYGHKRWFQEESELPILLKRVEKYPRACVHWLWGIRAFVLLYDPDYMKMVQGEQMRGTLPAGDNLPLEYMPLDPKAHIAYRYLKPWIGTGLLLLEGQSWFQHWRMLTPAFHYDILKPYVGLMADSVRVMLGSRAWSVPPPSTGQVGEAHHQDSHLEIFGYISLMTLGTIMKCAFSHQGSVQTDRKFQSYIQAIRDLGHLIFSQLRNALHQNGLIYRLIPKGCWNHQACHLTHQHKIPSFSWAVPSSDAVIKKRKAHLQKEGEMEKVRSRRHLDFLDILLFARMENGSSLSDKDLHVEVDTFMFKDHDTTANGLPFGEHLDQMPYTTMCIKEALRLYPPVPVIGREFSKPITFCDGCCLPAESSSLSFYGLHHNPKVWPNPEVRCHAFLPFSGGPRNCIGKQFAMNELKVAVTLTLFHFELSPDPSRVPVPTPVMVLRSKNGIHLQFRKLSDPGGDKYKL